MVSSGCLRWSLMIVVVALIVVLVAAATVVMASAVLQPPAVPKIELQPEMAAPGDVVAVVGRGWPSMYNLVVVIALSPTRELTTEGLVPVGAVLVGSDGTFATSFVLPASVPWTALKEAWVVARPPRGDPHAVARLVVIRPRPTATPSPAVALTPLPAKNLQGCIVSLSPAQSLVTVRPFDGSPNRGIVIRAAQIRFSDGRTATAADLQVGVSIVALGWFDSGGTLLATQITILGALSEPPAQQPAAICPVPTVTPCPPQSVAPAPVCIVPTGAPVAVCPLPTATCTPVPVVPKPTAACPPTSAPPPGPTCTPLPPPPTEVPWGPTPVPPDFWLAQYFANPSLEGAPAVVTANEVIDYSWGHRSPLEGLPKAGYSVRWSGNWTFKETRRYRFVLLLSGSARVWVDDRLLIDLWGCPAPGERATELELAAGLHGLKVEYANPGVDSRIQLRWEYADVAW